MCQPYRASNLPGFKPTGLQPYWASNLLGFKPTGLQTYWASNLPGFKPTGLQTYWASNLLGVRPRNGSTVCECCGSRRGSSSKHRCSSVFISFESLSLFACAFNSVCSVYSVVPYPFFYGECLPASATCRFPLLLPMGRASTKSSFILSGCTSHFDRKPFRNCRFPLSSNPYSS